MRTAYHEQLTALTNQLGEICGLAGIAMERATQSLLRADLVRLVLYLLGHEPQGILQWLPLTALYLLRESVWWLEMVLLGGLITVFIRQSASFRELAKT